jgi:hypothetical protein
MIPLRRSPAFALAAALAAVLVLPSCASVGEPASTPTGASADAAAEAWVESTLAALSLEERWGSSSFRGSPGPGGRGRPGVRGGAPLGRGRRIGGVVISIGTPLAYADKLNALQARARVPLLVTSDFENGGPGMRIAHLYALPTLLPAGGGTSFPPTMAFGAVGDEGLVARFAEATAREAGRWGCTWSSPRSWT